MTASPDGITAAPPAPLELPLSADRLDLDLGVAAMLAFAPPDVRGREGRPAAVA